METFFPFTLFACETPHFTSSEYAFRPTFLANKPKDVTWYAYDVSILSATEVVFVYFGMRDNGRGGIGEPLWTFKVAVSAALTRKFVESRAREIALARREAELIAAEKVILDRYAREALDSIKTTDIAA